MLFLGKRLLHAGLILLGVTLICYLLLFMLPADPARQIAGRSATPEVVENIRHQLGLDLPFYQQYWRYLQGLLHGDLGRSFIQRSEVSELVSARIGPSLQLMAAGILCELVLGIALGTPGGVKTRRAGGPASDGALLYRCFGAAVHRRDAFSLSFRRGTQLVPDGRLWRLQPSGATGANPRPARQRLVFTHVALVDD